MPANTIPQALALFDALSREGQIDAVTTMFDGAPSFDVVAQADRLPQIIRAWCNAGPVPADALALACARVVAASHALLVPAAPLPVAPAAPVIPVFAPQPVATPAPMVQIAPVSVPAVAPVPQPVRVAVAAAVAEALGTDDDAPPLAAAAVATLPRARGPVLARSLFADQPQSVLDKIPAALTVEYYAHPDAPAINPDFAFDGRILASVLGAIAADENVWYHGPRGTGKTEHARQLAARCGRAFFRVNFNRSTDAEDILGSLGITGGDTRFVYGPVAQAVKTEGAILLLDEPTYAVAAHFACLNPVLEKNGEPVRMPRTGEVLHIARGVVVIAADNTAGSGATSNEVIGRSPFSADNLDRFQKFVAFDYMPADMERRVLRAMVKRACGIKPTTEMARAVCKIVAVCRAKADMGELEGAPSLRRAVAFCVALAQGFDAADAYVDTVVNAAPQDSQEALRQIFAASWDHGNAQPDAAPVDPANPFADSQPV